MQLTVQHVDGMRFLATADGHTVVVDAAPQDGGGGTAISAPQLWMAALGACMLEFAVNSCRLHEVPVERCTLQIIFEEAPGPRRIGPVKAILHLEPEPPEDVKRRLIGVARHATLVNTLAQPPEVVMAFAGEGSANAGCAHNRGHP
jgi:uncharacterized OsmC-like protein